jgi:hypothetical protein
MPYAFYAALFALAVGTLIVPAGAQMIGRLIEMAGQALQLHGEGLQDACAIYRERWKTR